MALGLFLVKPQILEQRRLKTVVRLIEDEGFQILDMCTIKISAAEYEDFMKAMNREYEAVEVTLYSKGRCALFAVSHRSDEYYVHGGRVERGSKAIFFPGEAAVKEWFGTIPK